MRRIVIYLLSAAAAVISCSPVERDAEDRPEANYRIGFSQGDGTKSSIMSGYGASDSYAGIFAYAIYCEGKKIASSPSPAVTLCKDVKYNYYAVSGEPASWFMFPGNESDMDVAANYTAEARSFEELIADNASLPMSFHALNLLPSEMDSYDGSADGTIVFPLERLYARANLRVDTSSLDEGVTINSLTMSVRNAAASCALFNPESVNWKYVALMSSGDYDDSYISPDVTYVLYIPENLQGDLLPDNDNAAGKSEEFLSSAEAARTTYIEVSVNYTVPGGGGGDVKYRFYPGKNATSNFDIERNRTYDITLRLSSDGLYLDGSWKMDNSGFSDGRSLTLQAQAYNTLPGDWIWLRCNYDYPLKASDGNASALDWSYKYRTADGYAFGTKSQIDGWISSGTAPPYTPIVAGKLLCISCVYEFYGYPLASCGSYSYVDRLNFLKQNGRYDPSTHKIYCPVCAAEWYDDRLSSGDLFNKVFSGDGSYDVLGNFEFSPVHYGLIAYQIPPTATAGTTFTVSVATRDGRVRKDMDFYVRGDTVPYRMNAIPNGYMGETRPITTLVKPALMTEGEIRYEVDNESVASIEVRSGERLLKLLNPGTVTVRAVKKSDSSVLHELRVKVFTPIPSFSTNYTDGLGNHGYILDANGASIPAVLQYTDSTGKALSMDPSVWASIKGRFVVSFAGEISLTKVSDGKYQIQATDIPTAGTYDGTSETVPEFSAAIRHTIFRDEVAIDEASVPVLLRNPFYGFPSSNEVSYYHIRGTTGLYRFSTGSAVTGTNLGLFTKIVRNRGWKFTGGGSSVPITVTSTTEDLFAEEYSFEGSSVLGIGYDGETTDFVPGTLTLRGSVTNRNSGRTVTKDYAKVSVTEKVVPRVKWITIAEEKFAHKDEHRIIIDPKPLSGAHKDDILSLFDCTPVEIMPKTFASGKGFYLEKYVKESGTSYTVEWNEWDYLIVFVVVPMKLRDWTQEDFRTYNDPLFHRAGNPSAKDFDAYFDSSFSEMTPLGPEDSAYWVHYENVW